MEQAVVTKDKKKKSPATMTVEVPQGSLKVDLSGRKVGEKVCAYVEGVVTRVKSRGKDEYSEGRDSFGMDVSSVTFEKKPAKKGVDEMDSKEYRKARESKEI